MSSRQRAGSPPEPSRVRVLDAEPDAPSAPTPNIGLLWAVVALGAAMVAGLWVSGGLRGRPAAEVSVSSPPPIAAPPPQVPDVVGLEVTQVAAAMETAGFALDQAVPRQQWIASSKTPVGVVVEQRPAPGSVLGAHRLEVVISAGGPVVRFGDIPPDLREFAAALPGFDTTEPVLVKMTASGPAYKTDGWLFGECGAVLLAVETFADSSYGEDCIVRVITDVDGVLPDGTIYAISDLPGGSYGAEALSGAIMRDDEDGSRVLGISRYGRTTDLAPPLVELRDGVLHVAAGNWFFDVALSSDGPGGSVDGRASHLVAAIQPHLLDGHLYAVLDPPLRFQRPGEVPSRIGVDYGKFRVVAGCVTGVNNVVCDPTGAISVEAAESGFDLTGVTVRMSGNVATGSISHRDAATGVMVTYPPRWVLAEDSLVPEIVSPRDTFTLGTYPLRPGGELCNHMPENALRDLGPEDAFVSVFVANTAGPEWPADFGPDDLPPGDGQLDANACAERPDLDVRWGSFALGVRGAYVLVAFGEDVSDEVVAEAWAILSSVRRPG